MKKIVLFLILAVLSVGQAEAQWFNKPTNTPTNTWTPGLTPVATATPTPIAPAPTRTATSVNVNITNPGFNQANPTFTPTPTGTLTPLPTATPAVSYGYQVWTLQFTPGVYNYGVTLPRVSGIQEITLLNFFGGGTFGQNFGAGITIGEMPVSYGSLNTAVAVNPSNFTDAAQKFYSMYVVSSGAVSGIPANVLVVSVQATVTITPGIGVTITDTYSLFAFVQPKGCDYYLVYCRSTGKLIGVSHRKFRDWWNRS